MVSKMQLRLNKLDAFSVWFDNKPFIFLSSDKDTNVRIRFDIAHELGHLLMHSDYYSEEDLKIVQFMKNLKMRRIGLQVRFFCQRKHIQKMCFRLL